MNNIIVSGGSGYIGTHVTEQLLKKNNVVVYDLFYFPWISKNKKKIKNYKRLKFIKKNIKDISQNDFKDIDIVIDLNGISNDPASELNKSHTWKTNYLYRKKFAEVAKKAGVKRYIFGSTCSVYGFQKNKAYEDSKTKPISTYAKANLKAEKSIYKLKNSNFKVNCLRNATLYGYSNTMRLDLLINLWIYNILNNKKIIINGDGKQYRPFISIRDIGNIYDYVVQNNHKLGSFVCNLVAFNESVISLAKKIQKCFKKKKK